MTFMRNAIGSLSSCDSAGVRKQHSNTYIRELMNINHTTREISKRRIKWFKEMLTNLEDNKQLRSAVFGRLDKEDEAGSINIGTGPWVQLLIQDIQFLMDATHSWIDSDGERDCNMDYVNIKEMVEGSGTGNLMRIEVMEWILDVDISEFDSCEDVNTRCERTQENTSENNPNFDNKGNNLTFPLCDFVGRDFQRTRAHFKNTILTSSSKPYSPTNVLYVKKPSLILFVRDDMAGVCKETKHDLLKIGLDHTNSDRLKLKK